MTDSSYQTRLSQACSYISDSLRDLLGYLPSGRAGANEIFKIHSVVGWEQAQSRGLKRACAVAQGGG
eukprot:1106222-Pleurochrysis_carterae.AAC.1